MACGRTGCLPSGLHRGPRVLGLAAPHSDNGPSTRRGDGCRLLVRAGAATRPSARGRPRARRRGSGLGGVLERRRGGFDLGHRGPWRGGCDRPRDPVAPCPARGGDRGVGSGPSSCACGRFGGGPSHHHGSSDCPLPSRSRPTVAPGSAANIGARRARGRSALGRLPRSPGRIRNVARTWRLARARAAAPLRLAPRQRFTLPTGLASQRLSCSTVCICWCARASSLCAVALPIETDTLAPRTVSENRVCSR